MISIHAPHAGRDGGVTVSNGPKVSRFQSTRPMRGATESVAMSRDKAIFQSTRPMRGATCLLRRCLFRQEFQSTRPMRGATWEQDCSGERYCISIHAPHAGRDVSTSVLSCMENNFNPRAPCGARRPTLPSLVPKHPFQSTRPMRGATAKVYKITLHTFATKGNS